MLCFDRKEVFLELTYGIIEYCKACTKNYLKIKTIKEVKEAKTGLL